MTDFNLSNVAPNDVLVWSEIEEAFVNVKPSTQSLFIDLPDYHVTPLSQKGHNVVQRFTGEQLQTRTLVGGDGITITQSDGALEISAEDMDATTVGGHDPRDFFLVENQLSELDVAPLLDRLDVYTKDETHDEFMEANASNVPDMDNAYDLGANGRRYADIFALTFHGTATYALVAESLVNKGAKDGDLLVWRDNEGEWVPEDILANYIRTEGLQILPQYGERIHKPSTPSFDVSESNVFEYEFRGQEPATIEFIAPDDGNLYSITVILRNAENSDHVWPTNLKWIGMDRDPSKSMHDVFTFYTIDGANWFGSYVGSIDQ